MTRPHRIDRSRFGSLHLVHSQCHVLDRAFLTALRAFLLLAGRRYGLCIDTNIDWATTRGRDKLLVMYPHQDIVISVR